MDGQKILSFIVSQDLSALQWLLQSSPDPWLYHQASLLTLSKFYKALQKSKKLQYFFVKKQATSLLYHCTVKSSIKCTLSKHLRLHCSVVHSSASVNSAGSVMTKSSNVLNNGAARYSQLSLAKNMLFVQKGTLCMA